MVETTIQQQLQSDGYVVLRDVLDPKQDLQPVEDEYAAVLNHLVQQWKQDGLITSTGSELPFCDRLCHLLEQADIDFARQLDISLPQANVTEDTPIHTGPAIFGLLRNSRLLDAIEPILGPEIISNPVQHTRIKLPRRCLQQQANNDLTGDVSWHQDLAVVTPDADQTELLTVWIPMTQATEEMGCLEVVPGSHDQLNLHCRSTDPRTQNQLSIPPHLIGSTTVPLPMEPGDVLLMDRRMQHRALPNTSDRIRWSFDLRYQPAGQPTGRRWFPDFVARSRSAPDTELTDATIWSAAWHRTRSYLATSEDIDFNRWIASDPRCA